MRLPPRIPDHELSACIGEGSYGEVWLARSVSGAWRAVKIVYRSKFESDRPYEREFAGILKFEPISRTHESQVNILHVGRNDAESYFFYIMELADDASGAPGQPVRDPRAGAHHCGPQAPKAPAYIPKTLKTELKRRSRLSGEECLEIGLALTTALGHLHKHGLVHRDIKPSNVIFVNGIPKLADIGLVTDVDRTSSFVGTDGYYPPEGPGTRQADIYSLGKVLYEISTGRDRMEFPALPGDFDTGEQRLALLEMTAVFGKACAGHAPDRYATAEELHADLALLRSGKSVRRQRQLERRLRVLASTVGLSVLVAAGSWFFQRQRTAAAEAREEAQRQENLLQRIEQIRLGSRFAGWTTSIADLVTQAARRRTDVTLRSSAAAALCGVDVHPVAGFTNIQADSAVFGDPGGALFLGDYRGVASAGTPFSVGGLNLHPQTESDWFGFRPNGQVLQVTRRGPWSFRVQNLAADRAEWALDAPPVDVAAASPAGSSAGCALAADGSCFAALMPGPGKESQLVLWDVLTGKVIDASAQEAHIVALSADGSMIALGDRLGTIRFGNVHRARTWSVLPKPLERQAVTALAFCRNPRLAAAAAESAPPESAWKLAQGNEGGQVVLWDLATRNAQAYFRGSPFQVNALAFSPDGATLASGSLLRVRLWDVATSELLIEFPVSGAVTGLSFSPDHRHLAVGCDGGQQGASGSVSVWEIESGRGIQTLRGLSAQVLHVCYSPKGRYLAALAQDWVVGVWNLEQGRLECLLSMPPGLSADNAGLAFSPEEDLLAFAAGTSAVLWDLTSRRLRASVNLPAGLVDRLAFHPSGKLLLFRMELLDPGLSPAADPFREAAPRVCRIRDLLSATPEEPCAVISAFNRQVFDAVGQMDGRYFVVDGEMHQNGTNSRAVKLYDGLTGAELWSASVLPGLPNGGLYPDPTGKFLALQFDTNAVLLAMPEARPVRLLPSLMVVGPEAELGTVRNALRAGLSLFRVSDPVPLISLGIDQRMSSVMRFDAPGRRLAWGNADGSVLVCNLPEIQRRLSLCRLDWPRNASRGF